MSTAVRPPLLGRRRRLSPSDLTHARRVYGGIALLTLLAAVVRFATLDVQSFWYDEALTHQLVTGGFGPMLDGVLGHEAQPPLYFVLAWGWTRVFGDDEIALRSLSALLGTLTVPVAYAAARAVAGRRVAAAVGVLTALSPPLVWYSQEARAYALVALLAALSLLLFLRALEQPRTGRLVLWVVASLLAVVSHYFALFLVLPEAAWLLWRTPDRGRTARALAGFAVGLLLIAPMLLYQRAHGGVDWIGMVPIRPRLGDVAFFFGVGPQAPRTLADHRAIVAVLTAVAFLGAFAAAARWTSGERRRSILLVLGLATCVVAAPLVLALGGSDLVLDRNFLLAWVPAVIVAVAGLFAVPVRWLAPAGVAVTALLFAAVVVDVSRYDTLQRDDWRDVAARLGPARADRVIEVSPHWHQLTLGVYLPRLQPMTAPRAVSTVATVTLGGFVPFGQPVFAVPPPPPFRRVRTETVQRLTITWYRAPRPVLLDPTALSGPGRNGPEPFLEPAA